MDEAALLARLEEQRTRWADLPKGKRVKFLRPFETDLHRFRAGITIDQLSECVCGWDGFTEADLLGAAIGSSDPVKFTPKLWDRVLRDKVDYFEPIADALVKSITEHLASKDETAKN